MNQRDRTRSREEAIDGQELLSGASRARALFFLAAGLSFLMSVYLFFGGHREQGIFVGIWVPSILSAGSLMLGREVDE